MICKSCGQGEPVVEFRTFVDHGTARTYTKCRSCERDDAKARRLGKLVSPTKQPVVKPDKESDALRKELETLRAIHPTSPATIESAKATDGSVIACMVASDWHVEESVEASKVHGINEYNLGIAKERAYAFFRNGLRLTDIFAQSSKLDTIYLMILGDTFSNYIHEELRETNLLGPAEAANYALELLNDGINFLLSKSKYNLIIDCIPGNHGRMTQRPRIAHATETSLESFMYQQLAVHYKDDGRVKFRVANSKMLYRQFFKDYTVRLVHGDDVSYGGGVGGVTIPIRKKLAAWDKAVRADLTVMGHFHQFLDGGDFIVNGSLIGYNEYAQAIGASPEEPRQAFFLLHERHGGSKAVVAPIWLD
jgi:hypothetical protein